MTDRTRQAAITACALTLGALAVAAKGIQWANDYLSWKVNRRPLPSTHTAQNPIIRYHRR